MLDKTARTERSLVFYGTMYHVTYMRTCGVCRACRAHALCVCAFTGKIMKTPWISNLKIIDTPKVCSTITRSFHYRTPLNLVRNYFHVLRNTRSDAELCGYSKPGCKKVVCSTNFEIFSKMWFNCRPCEQNSGKIITQKCIKCRKARTTSPRASLRTEKELHIRISAF